MRLRASRSGFSADARRPWRAIAAFAVVLAALGPGAAPTAAVDGPTMEARILLNGNARIGSWMAVQVHLVNNGPAVSGELRLAGGSQGQTRFGTAVDLPTQSDKTYVLYAQPPAFGSELEIVLASGEQKVASTKAKFSIHDTTQLVVAVVAERPEGIVGNLRLLPNQNQVAALVMSIAPEDLPERVEGWNMLDRIVWQDVDADRLTPAQLESLRGWVAAGGRLVIAGGTAGPKSLSAFPDVLLPYRPTATTDVPVAALGGLLGEVPATQGDVPALSGELAGGRALATVGDRVVAAERTYGTGQVTLLGFDPAADWMTESKASEGMWRRLLPARSSGGLVFSDDNMLVSAVSQLPSLALPPIGGLIVLLGAYILLIGPLNYLVLRRLDRREWAWLTMPVLVVVFTVGAYGFGAVLRGNDVIVNEVAIVSGAPGATDGSGQIYVGIFSPSRGRYQVRVPGGALLSAPINDFFGGQGAATQLDVLQGDPARVRDLAVGFGSLRTIRAETPVTVPLIRTNLRLEDGRLKGTVKNLSNERLDKPAVVLGGTVATLKDLEPGAEATIDVLVQNVLFGQSLSDKVVGQIFFGDGRPNADTAALNIRHSMVDQLTYDPNFGSTGQLATEGPVVLAWGSRDLLHIEIEDQEPRRLGNVLYYLAARMTISGTTSFRSDLIRSSVVDSDAAFFSKDPYSINFGRGTATIAYRPTTFEGTLEATELAFGLNFGGDTGLTVKPTPVEPLPSIPPRCPNPPTPECAPVIADGLPEVEVYDLKHREWKRLPHLSPGPRYAVADPANYVDPTTGTVLIRYVNDRMDSVGFSVDVSITGAVR
ncbi:MAG: hypothetical protein Q7S35_08980 [Candidatus Limnocylindrales bacterium]|nr:hypothetical protein [Candidatus Limnocylindrales bacterium]